MKEVVELIGTNRANQILAPVAYMNTKTLEKYLSSCGIEPIGMDGNGNFKWALSAVCALAEKNKKPERKPVDVDSDTFILFERIDLSIEVIESEIETLKKQNAMIFQALNRIEEVLKQFAS